MNVADPEQFSYKGKPITYTWVFVELYNKKNRQQVHEIHEIEFEKMGVSTAENLYNLGAHRIIEILSVLRNGHVIPRDQDKLVFYVNNYIDWNQFNGLYNPD